MVVLLVVVLGLLAAGEATVVVLVSARTPPPRELLPSSPEYRNHQAMARWIQRRLDDDLVRPLVREEDQEEARRLLAEFYGEDR